NFDRRPCLGNVRAKGPAGEQSPCSPILPVAVDVLSIVVCPFKTIPSLISESPHVPEGPPEEHRPTSSSDREVLVPISERPSGCQAAARPRRLHWERCF